MSNGFLRIRKPKTQGYLSLLKWFNRFRGNLFSVIFNQTVKCSASSVETSQKLLEVEKWSPEGDDVALRNSTFIRRLEPFDRDMRGTDFRHETVLYNCFTNTRDYLSPTHVSSLQLFELADFCSPGQMDTHATSPVRRRGASSSLSRSNLLGGNFRAMVDHRNTPKG